MVDMTGTKAANALAAVAKHAETCRNLLAEAGFPDFANTVEKIRGGAVRTQFTVAVVGEFSRGKSTLVNHLLDRPLLPVGDLPTTAVLTKIRHGRDECIRFADNAGNEISSRPLGTGPLAELTRAPSRDADGGGVAEIDVDNPWLEKSGIVLFDTPGAGDLDECRARQIGDMIWSCDGVVIAVSALQPLGLSERTFIQERIIARQFPSVMVVVTKLDLVPEGERAGLLEFVRKRLASWKLGVPVFTTDLSVLPEAARKTAGGLAVIRRTIEAWGTDANRIALKCARAKANVSSILGAAVESLSVREELLRSESNEKRAAMIAQKQARLSAAKTDWAALNAEMDKRCTACYETVAKSIDEMQASIIERLQFEVRHNGQPGRWWVDDFPYRAKIELANMAAQLDSAASRQIAADARWYNDSLSRVFHSAIGFSLTKIFEKPADPVDPGEAPSLENLDRKQSFYRIASAVLMISGSVCLPALGFAPLIATMGLGTGASIYTGAILKRKLEEQRQIVATEVAARFPALVRAATAQAERRLEEVYASILREGEAAEAQWLAAQQKGIDVTVDAAGKLAIDTISEKNARLAKALADLERI